MSLDAGPRQPGCMSSSSTKSGTANLCASPLRSRRVKGGRRSAINEPSHGTQAVLMVLCEVSTSYMAAASSRYLVFRMPARKRAARGTASRTRPQPSSALAAPARPGVHVEHHPPSRPRPPHPRHAAHPRHEKVPIIVPPRPACAQPPAPHRGQGTCTRSALARMRASATASWKPAVWKAKPCNNMTSVAWASCPLLLGISEPASTWALALARRDIAGMHVGHHRSAKDPLQPRHAPQRSQGSTPTTRPLPST